MVSGTLALKISKVENLPTLAEEGLAGYSFAIKVKVAGAEKRTKYSGKGHESTVDQTLNFDLKDVDGSDEVQFEVLQENKKKAVAHGKVALADFMQGFAFTSKIVPLNKGVKIYTESKWEVKNVVEKYGGDETAKAAEQVKETAASVVTVNPQRALAVKETHRPWFTRVSYYYDATKNVYNYTTSFRLIASVARLGENSANAVLQKVAGKNLHELDQGVLVPTLSTLDNKVDETISTVIVKLVEGQNYVLKKKNDVVDTTSAVTKKATEKVSGVVGSTLETVNKAKDYTTSQIKSVSSTAYGTVVNAKDYTTSQVVNVSSSAYGTVRATTVYIVSHVPYLGSKIRA